MNIGSQPVFESPKNSKSSFPNKKVLTEKGEFAGRLLAVATLTATVVSIIAISTGCFGNISVAFGAASAGLAFLSFGAREIIIAVDEKDEESGKMPPMSEKAINQIEKLKAKKNKKESEIKLKEHKEARKKFENDVDEYEKYEKQGFYSLPEKL